MGCPDQLAVKQDFLDQDGRLLSSLATKEQADEILDKLGRVETGIDTSIPGAIANILDSIVSVVRDPIVAAIEANAALFNNIVDSLENAILESIKATENVITSGIEETGNLIAAGIKATENVIVSGIDAVAFIVDDVRGIVKGIEGITQNLEDIATAGFDTLDNLINANKEVILAAIAAGESLWKETLDAAKAIAPYLESVIVNAQDFLENLINQYFQTLRSLINALPTDFPDFNFDDGNIISEIKKVDRKLGIFPYDCSTQQISDGAFTTVSESLQRLTCGSGSSDGSTDNTTEDLSNLSTRELLEKMADAIGINEFPGEVPKSLLNSGDYPETQGTETIKNLTQFLLWIVKQVDALAGEFPIEIQVEDTDLVTAGKQTQTIELDNIAETLSELFTLAFANKTISEANLACSTRLAPEINASRIAAMKSYDVARANAEFLGYQFKNPKKKMGSNFNYSEGLISLANFFEQKEYEYSGFEFDGEEVLPQFLQNFMFASQILKGAFFRSGTEELDRLQEEIDKSEGEQDTRWDDFVNEVNNPDSQFNQGQSTRPFLKDSQED